MDRMNIGNSSENEYKSSISSGAFSSKGQTVRELGSKTGRLHLNLSRLEHKYFLMLEFADNVKEIRDQYGLNLEETQAIARSLGIKHPWNYKKNKIHPMSTDFVVDLEDKTIARSVKPLGELNKRIIEKFEIERAYWEKRDVEWAIVTEEQLPENIVSNLLKFRDYYLMDLPNGLLHKVLNEWISSWNDNSSFEMHVKTVCNSLKISYGECNKVVLHLLARKKLHFNHSYKFSNNLQLKDCNCHVKNFK